MNELGNGATTTAEGLGIRANPNFPSHIDGAGAASRKSKIFKIPLSRNDFVYNVSGDVVLFLSVRRK
jgi:hypothetical protein